MPACLAQNALVTTNVFLVTDAFSPLPSRTGDASCSCSRHSHAPSGDRCGVHRDPVGDLPAPAGAGRRRLVEAEKVGRQRIYRVLPVGLQQLQAEIDRFWTDELDSLVADAHATEEKAMTFTKSVALPVSPDEAFALITEPERLRRWQTVSAYVDLRAGGAYRWTVTPGHVAAGTFREVEPGTRVVFGWGWEGDRASPPDASTVTVTDRAGRGGSQVTLVHEGLDEEQAERARRGLGRTTSTGSRSSRTTGDAVRTSGPGLPST